jgi:hypothetical protein
LKYFLLLPVFLITTFLQGQKLTFDIFLFGGKIGETVVERTVKNDSITEYTLNSRSEAHIFFTHRIITLVYDILFKHDQLFSSYSKHTRNDEVHITNIMHEGNRYMIKMDNTVSYLNAAVNCSTVKLFFAEPCSLDKVLSERMGQFRNFKKTGNGEYEAEMSEGITYYYRYKNGKLAELEMHKSILGSIYLRPHEQGGH